VSGARPASQETPPPSIDAIQAAPPTALPATVRRQIFLFLGILVLLVTIGSPAGGMFVIALALLLKNKLHLSPTDQSDFLALAAIPLYLSPFFGFVRDLWSPFGMRDRGFILLFGSLTLALYLVLAFVPITWATLLGAVLLLRISFRLVSSAEAGLLATLGQQHTMSGQMSTTWNVVLSMVAAGSYLLAGTLADLLEAEGADRAFHFLFLVGALVVAGVVLFAWFRPGVIFDNVRTECGGRVHPIADLGRLARHAPIYPALLIWLLWGFAPGTETPLLNYLQRTFHATDTEYGEWNAIFAASFIPTTVAFGMLSTRVSLSRLLAWGTLVGIPQMLPLLFIPSVKAALIAAVPMGLMGGIATSAYTALIIRSCPSGLQGTVLMLSAALAIIVARLGDMLGTRLYDNFGGFQTCVIAITIVYAMILPILPLIPRGLVSTADGEIGEPAE
jgi:hypothetical protein